MTFLKTAWGQATGWQRAAIIVAGLISVIALSSIAGGEPRTAEPGPTDVAAVETRDLGADDACRDP